jgi:hypothetical protein
MSKPKKKPALSPCGHDGRQSYYSHYGAHRKYCLICGRRLSMKAAGKTGAR